MAYLLQFGALSTVNLRLHGFARILILQWNHFDCMGVRYRLRFLVIQWSVLQISSHEFSEVEGIIAIQGYNDSQTRLCEIGQRSSSLEKMTKYQHTQTKPTERGPSGVRSPYPGTRFNQYN